MLNFFIEIREKERKTGAREITVFEGWFKAEIVRKLYMERLDVDPNEKKGNYDFKVDNISIELKTSGSFTYKGAHNRLLNEMRSGKKNPDCWMFITVYDKEKEAKMLKEPELSDSYYKLEKIPNTKPEWCVILICKKAIANG